ncbi:hypothetical protein CHUAL_013797 [Chamberlinius hualienensis]
MHLHFEKSTNARCDCPLLSLTWMGKVPDEMPADEEGWKLNRTNYYQEGWLATGNVRGVVGVTFTSCHCTKTTDMPLRTNYNLRGHRTEVFLVKWNEPYQKLASCDSSGIIFVWIKYEGRWSIELINDRNTQVTDFSWSHDGRMALICYHDGFVLVGSVAGQRYWSSMLDITGTITCGIWSPDDRQVLFGTSYGQVVVMDVHGVMVVQVSILEGTSILSMGWSCEKFKMEEGDEDDDDLDQSINKTPKTTEKPASLAVCFKNGLIYIMKNYDDVSPIIITTGLKGLKMEWTNAGDVLAVAGTTATSTNNNTPQFTNYIQFYTDSGTLRHTRTIPSTQHPISAMTWGHNDKRLFIATGPYIHVGWVTRKVASLQLLSRLAIYHHLSHEQQARCLSLPKKLLTIVVGLFSPTLKTCFPEPHQLKDFVSRPPEGGARYHCTMIRHDDEIYLNSGGTCYTLYLEYLGGLVPLLKGKRSSKIRPEFIIYDPQASDGRSNSDSTVGEENIIRSGRLGGVLLLNGCHGNGVANQSDSDTDDGCASPRLQRRRKQMKKLLRDQLELEQRLVNGLAYVDTLPEHDSLVIVTSNIWGTKFKINGVDTNLPSNLGQVTYKTSLLHLQPRQMTLSVTELRDDVQLEMDVNYNPNIFSEEEDDTIGDEEHTEDECSLFPLCHKEGPPIAPMTPRPPNRRSMIAVASPSWSDFSCVSTKQTTTRAPVTTSSSYFDGSTDSQVDDYVDFMTNSEMTTKIGVLDRAGPSFTCQCVTCIERHSDNRVPTNVCDIQDDPSCSYNARSVAHKLANHRSTSFVSGSASCPTNCQPKSYFDLNSKLSPTLPVASTVIINGQMRGDNANQRSLRWAEKACELKFIDDDEDGASSQQVSHLQNEEKNLNKCRSHSVGQLSAINVQDQNVEATLRELKRRLILSGDSDSQCKQQTSVQRSPSLVQCGKSHSLESENQKTPIETRKPPSSPPEIVIHSQQRLPRTSTREAPQSPASPRPHLYTNHHQHNFINGQHYGSTSTPQVVRTAPSSPLLSSSRPSSPLLDRNILTVTPPTPRKADFRSKHKKNDLRRKSLLNSPLLSRRTRRTKVVESSDDELALSGDENGSNSRPLTPSNSFKEHSKSVNNNKLKKERWLSHSNGSSTHSSPCHTPPTTTASNIRCSREFIMHNKAPLWNEHSQVYQLDFGGRVTQESAKNFQIEFRGKQVMQFGRIDGNAYTLDFQYPFTALQAFAVALANVTQRLK